VCHLQRRLVEYYPYLNCSVRNEVDEVLSWEGHSGRLQVTYPARTRGAELACGIYHVATHIQPLGAAFAFGTKTCKLV
jgi:hypothetical protein